MRGGDARHPGYASGAPPSYSAGRARSVAASDLVRPASRFARRGHALRRPVALPGAAKRLGGTSEQRGVLAVDAALIYCYSRLIVSTLLLLAATQVLCKACERALAAALPGTAASFAAEQCSSATQNSSVNANRSDTKQCVPFWRQGREEGAALLQGARGIRVPSPSRTAPPFHRLSRGARRRVARREGAGGTRIVRRAGAGGGRAAHQAARAPTEFCRGPRRVIAKRRAPASTHGGQGRAPFSRARPTATKPSARPRSRSAIRAPQGVPGAPAPLLQRHGRGPRSPSRASPRRGAPRARPGPLNGRRVARSASRPPRGAGPRPRRRVRAPPADRSKKRARAPAASCRKPQKAPEPHSEAGGDKKRRKRRRKAKTDGYCDGGGGGKRRQGRRHQPIYDHLASLYDHPCFFAPIMSDTKPTESASGAGAPMKAKPDGDSPGAAGGIAAARPGIMGAAVNDGGPPPSAAASCCCCHACCCWYCCCWYCCCACHICCCDCGATKAGPVRPAVAAWYLSSRVSGRPVSAAKGRRPARPAISAFPGGRRRRRRGAAWRELAAPEDVGGRRRRRGEGVGDGRRGVLQ